MSARSVTIKLDEKGRIQLPADLRARLKTNPGDEFVIGESTSDTIILKKMDLATIMNGVIDEARKVISTSLSRISRKRATGLHERDTRFYWTLTFS